MSADVGPVLSDFAPSVSEQRVLEVRSSGRAAAPPCDAATQTPPLAVADASLQCFPGAPAAVARGSNPDEDDDGGAPRSVHVQTMEFSEYTAAAPADAAALTAWARSVFPKAEAALRATRWTDMDAPLDDEMVRRGVAMVGGGGLHPATCTPTAWFEDERAPKKGVSQWPPRAPTPLTTCRR